MQAKLGELFAKYVLPFLYGKIVDWLENLGQRLIDALKQEKIRRAYSKVSETEQKKFDAVDKNPASTPLERANAYKDLINAKPDQSDGL